MTNDGRVARRTDARNQPSSLNKDARLDPRRHTPTAQGHAAAPGRLDHYNRANTKAHSGALNICHRMMDGCNIDNERTHKAFPERTMKHALGHAACGPQARTKQQRMNATLSWARGLHRSSTGAAGAHSRTQTKSQNPLSELSPTRKAAPAQNGVPH